MKKLVTLAVTAAALALASGKAEATSGGNLVLTISGSVEYQTTNSDTVGKTKTASFNTASIYNMISNAVANAGNGIATNLPAKGIIEFDPEGYDQRVSGVFYVTDKANDFYYPLSGFDTNNDYYSFIELDSYVITDNSDIELGFDNAFDGSASYSLNASGNGSLNGKDTALLFVHDNPYVNDLGDNPDNFYSQYDSTYDKYEYITQAFEIQGIMTVHLTFKSGSPDSGSLSLTGTGNAVINDNSDASVISGHASL